MSDIDISSLKRIDTTLLTKLPENDFAAVLEGSGLFYNSNTKKVEFKAGDQTVETDRSEFINQIKGLVAADSNTDSKLSSAEVKSYLDGRKITRVTPDQFSQGLAERASRTYALIANKLQAYGSQKDYKFFLSVLQEYSQGIFDDDYRQAHESLRSNAPHKSLGNLLVVGYAPYKWIAGKKEGESYWPMDNWASSSAKSRFEERTKALQALADVFKEGVSKGEDWAVKSDVNAAIEKLASAEYRSILKNDLVAGKLHDLFSMEVERVAPGDSEDVKRTKIEAQKKRANAMYDFAIAELSKVAGYGGGNSGKWFDNGWNISGKHNNIRFARDLLHTLQNHAHTDDAVFNSTMMEKANKKFEEIRGNGGSFSNLAWVGFTTVTSLGGKIYKPTERRLWGEEELIGAPGQLAVTALSFYGGYKGLQGAKDVLKLKPLTTGFISERAIAEAAGDADKISKLRPSFGGWVEAWKSGRGFSAVWKAWGENKWKRVPMSGMGTASRDGALSARAIAEAEAAGKAPNLFGRFMEGLGRYTTKPLVEFATGAKAGAPEGVQKALDLGGKALKGAGKVQSVLVDGIIVFGIAGVADDATNSVGYYETLDINYEFNGTRVIKKPTPEKK